MVAVVVMAAVAEVVVTIFVVVKVTAIVEWS